LSGQIESVPFVEGDYQVGLFVNTGDFCGDIFGLANMTVAAQLSSTPTTPYLPQYRGICDLRYDFVTN
jgi:hypothetical protein